MAPMPSKIATWMAMFSNDQEALGYVSPSARLDSVRDFLQRSVRRRVQSGGEASQDDGIRPAQAVPHQGRAARPA
jgi:hypothetical protein